MSSLNTTNISWTHRTWNPWSGCTKVSPGCQFCYAEKIAEDKRGTAAFPNGFDLTLRRHRLLEPIKLRTPSRIFVNSTSDIFLEQVPDEDVLEVFEVMNRCYKSGKGHIFQVLTKRSKRLIHLADRIDWTPNIWMGVSVENRRWTSRLDDLVQVPARIRFVSAEPLLGPLGDLSPWLPHLHWMIVGGESGPHLRNHPRRWMDHGWAREIRDQCVQQRPDVPFFFKQSSGLRSEQKPFLQEEDGTVTTWGNFPRTSA
jgi:protein gp37